MKSDKVECRTLCGLCEGYKTMYRERERETLAVDVDNLGGQWWLNLSLHKENPYWEDENIACPIVFCPFCGRKLPTNDETR